MLFQMHRGRGRGRTFGCGASRRREETLFFGVVLAVDEAHVFGHVVAVVPRRPEGIFGDEPAFGEDGKIAIRHARLARRDVRTVKMLGSG